MLLYKLMQETGQKSVYPDFSNSYETLVLAAYEDPARRVKNSDTTTRRHQRGFHGSRHDHTCQLARERRGMSAALALVQRVVSVSSYRFRNRDRSFKGVISPGSGAGQAGP